MAAADTKLGPWGEALAAAFLRKRGYHIVATNYRSRYGESDLIAWDGDGLCFVEVKTRTNLDMALPREYVTPQKQNKLRKTARMYLAEKRLDCPARFDVAEVYVEHGFDEARIEYLENAFQ